ncbi:hypothetical protein DXG03_000210 [Asterophora parasitica]|uniref:GTP cyclohydrolase II n=1 Tax=Asterophora parasitica TaxID=117018 RepID=A0A9P7GF80_9AGAR|nr:hypothetical protein DXG03_000210 [Asterophora parasitica]
MSRNHHEDSDAALLDILTAPVKPTPKVFARRDAALDPLLIAAAAASGPNVTRNHYHHDFFPGVALPQHEGSWDWTKFSGGDAADRRRLTYKSLQAPRRQRLHEELEEGKENDPLDLEADPLKSADNIPHSAKKRRSSIISPATEVKPRAKVASTLEHVAPSPVPALPPVEVKCMARTRIPTPHGPAFLHLYHNTRDTKEHLAIVIDPAQLSDHRGPVSAPPIRSRTLDAVWEGETEMDRITRGAYVGRLSATSQKVSEPVASISPEVNPDIPSPLIRIHSECFTGETVGSMRCDCGEQLDEAIRQISLPITVPSPSPLLTGPTTIPGRGAVVYLRQEGRGIGLLSKIRAYNLQDLGHDTVTANLMLGHQADERGYEIACAILRDLGLGGVAGTDEGEGVRVLTNNPDKVEALQKEGLDIVERVPMIPRSWQKRDPSLVAKKPTLDSNPYIVQHNDDERVAGATLIGGNAVYGDDLDKYLRTKVVRMGHILPLWMEEQSV